MSKHEFFRRSYDLPRDLLVDLLQQAMDGMPTITSHRLADSGDRITFRTSFTLTSWGEKMVAEVREDGPEGSVLIVSGEPRVGLLSTPWGEEIHAGTIETQLLTAVAGLVTAAQANPILALQADHRRTELLFARITAAEGEQREALVAELLKALRIHMELEERLVYPLLGRDVDAWLAEESEVEHQLARDGLARLDELSPDEPGFDAALTMVVAGIEHHVAEEETQAFPALAAHLGADGLADLAKRVTEARAELLAEASEASQNGASRRGSQRTRRTSAQRTGRNGQRREDGQKRQSRQGRQTAARARRNGDAADITRAELVDRAKRAGIAGYSNMTKAELAKALG